MNDKKRDRIVILFDNETIKKIDDKIMEKKIRNFQDAYRDIFMLGFKIFNKGGKTIG